MTTTAVPLRERLLELSMQLELIAKGDGDSAGPMRLRDRKPDDDLSPEWWMRQASQIYAARRLRDKFFPSVFFGEAAWDILIELFILDLQDRRSTVKRACAASAIPHTTALRWISILFDEKLISRSTERGDRRVVWLSLTPKGNEAIRGFILAREALFNRPSPEFMLITGGRGR